MLKSDIFHVFVFPDSRQLAGTPVRTTRKTSIARRRRRAFDDLLTSVYRMLTELVTSNDRFR
jgi:hypothetical protein